MCEVTFVPPATGSLALGERLVELGTEVILVAAALVVIDAAKAETWAKLWDVLGTETAIQQADLAGIRKAAQNEFIDRVCPSAVTALGSAMGIGGLKRVDGGPKGASGWSLEAVRQRHRLHPLRARRP